MAKSGTERKREWRLKNPEKSSAYHKAWREQNRERVRANNRAYRERNSEKVAAYNKAYREKNLKRSAEHSAKYRAKNPGKLRIAYKREYNLHHVTSVRHRQLVDSQHGVCAICYRPETTTHKGRLRRLAADHDHVTGEWRGLLCSMCNTMIGLARENTAVLQRAIEYLHKYRRDEVA